MKDRMRVTQLLPACGPEADEEAIDGVLADRLDGWEEGEAYVRETDADGDVREVWLLPEVWWGIVADVRGVDLGGGEGRLGEDEIDEMLEMISL